MSGLLLDLRLVLRGSRRQRASSIATVLTLAVGVCALAAALAVARAALVTPFPYERPKELVDLQSMRMDEPGSRFGIYPADFLAWREEGRSFAGMAGYLPFGSMDLVPPAGEPQRLRARWVSAGYFEVLGVPPAHGRTFLAEEEQAGRDRVVVLAHRLFTERFGADPRIVGASIRLDGEAWRVVGVMPPQLGVRGGDPDLWAPLSFGPHRPADRAAAYLGAVARLAPGRSLAAARAEMAALGARLEASAPDTNEGLRPSVEPLLDVLRGGQRPAFRLLLAAAALVLLVGVVNAWSLLLARARAGEGESRVRRALGARPWRAARLLLLEAACLALVGVAAGGLLARAALAALPDLGGKVLYHSVDLRLDPRSFLGAACVATLLALAAGGWVALRAAPAPAVPRSSRGGGGAGRRHGEGARVVVQVALSVVLLLAALTTLRRVAELAARDLGYDPAGVLAFDLAPPQHRYPDATAVAALYAGVLGELERLATVEAAGAANDEPGSGWGFGALAEGAAPESEVAARFLVATPGFFPAAGLRLVEGRLFDERDAAGGEPVALASAGLARDLFGERGALSGSVLFEGIAHRVVGVVTDVRGSDGDAPGRYLYLPFAQQATLLDQVGQRGMVVLVRGRGNLAAAAREAVRRRDPQLPLSAIGPLAARSQEDLFRPRLLRQVLGLFAVAALLLTALGLYGTLAGDMTRRRFELGVRLALGARPGELVAMVMRRTLAWTFAGLLLAAPLALAAQGWLGSRIEGVRPWSAPTLAAVVLLIVAMAVAAAWLPASRVRRIAPAEALRCE